jgi:site-specific DNA recombinase
MTDRRRCAIYTRKSTDEGLEQGFNSLHAQREACEAFVKSQAHEGWKPLSALYDDGGFSGGSMERPALQRLLTDIDSGLIDTVVVYKVDRLTRSLSDFARMVEKFDSRGVSFVSVTQQFNTTTSMGRLTLNVLLSFAQFEREVTAERIRDKIAASKKKGIWMGGLVPMGYDTRDRSLVVNPPEAETVRTIFGLYLELGTVRRLKEAADRLGLTTKQRPQSSGQTTGGRPFTRGHLYQMLSNPIYVGKIAHKGASYPGQHDAIIDRERFEAVQRNLAGNAASRQLATNTKSPSLLTGLVYDETGDRLCPTHTNKKGRRYRYYISNRLKHNADSATDGWRLPASQLEATVLQAIQSFLKDEVQLADALKLVGLRPDRLRRALVDTMKVADELSNEPSDRQQQLISNLLHRVELGADSMHIEIKRSGLTAFLAEKDTRAAACAEGMFEYAVAIQLKRRGVEAKLVMLTSADHSSSPDINLVGVLADAHRWIEDLAQARACSVLDLARRSNRGISEVSRTLSLAFLAPTIVSAILEGRHPRDFTPHRFKRTTLPGGWTDQRRLLGFPEPALR